MESTAYLDQNFDILKENIINSGSEWKCSYKKGETVNPLPPLRFLGRWRMVLLTSKRYLVCKERKKLIYAIVITINCNANAFFISNAFFNWTLHYVHTLQIGSVPKLICFVMACPHNMWNVPELFVHIAIRTGQLQAH